MRHVLLALVALSLGGCTTHSFSTSGPVRPPNGISAIEVAFETNRRLQGEIIKSAPGIAPTITATDKAKAVDDANVLNGIFARGFSERFPVDAAKHGLSVGDRAGPNPRLKVSVTWFERRCTIRGCVSEMRLNGDLLTAEGTRIWNFHASVGNPSIFDEQLTDDIFLSFEKTLFARMRADGVIRGY